MGTGLEIPAMMLVTMLENRRQTREGKADARLLEANRKKEADAAALELATTTHDQTSSVGGAVHMAARESVEGGSTYLTAGRTAGVSGPTGKGKRKKIGSMATYDTTV